MKKFLERETQSSPSIVKNFSNQPRKRSGFHVLDPNLRVPRGMCALAVMTKAPQAGQVKTRLVPPLTPDEAAELNKCFLRDTSAAIAACCSPGQSGRPPNSARAQFRSGAHRAPLQCRGIAVYTPVGSESVYTDLLPGDFSLLPQRGVGFGERLRFAVEDLFKCGFDSVCLIDSDSPTVPAENFATAVELLKTSDDSVVLGPSYDGGYYLIGLKKPHRELFEQIDWSTERVFDQTMRRAREIGLAVKLLPPGYDIDDAASLRRLCNEVLANVSNVAPRTREFLRELVAQQRLDFL